MGERTARAVGFVQRVATWMAAVAIAWPPIASAQSERSKQVGTDWVWFTDYAFLWSEWTLNAEAGCELEVGTGMKIAGKPRGSVRRFEQHIQIKAWGAGAIHVRAVGGRAPCMVRVDPGEAGVIGIYSDPSLTRGVIRDGKIVYDKIRDAVR